MEAMRYQIQMANKLTHNKPFAVNVWPIKDEPKEDANGWAQLEMMAQEHVKAVVYGGILRPKWVKAYQDHGMKVIYRDFDPSAENTKAAVKAGVDVIVATGFDEGGSIPHRQIGTFSIVPLVVDAAEGKVPVLAAGGIADARTVKAAFDLGAEGVYVGSAFLTAEECPIPKNIKDDIVNDDATDLVLFRWTTGHYRSLPGKLPSKLVQMDKDLKPTKEIFDAAHGVTGILNGMAKGDLNDGYASPGCGITLQHKIEPAKDIVARLYAGVPEKEK